MPKSIQNKPQVIALRFPSIFRFITEDIHISNGKRYIRLFIVSFVSGFFLIAIGIQTNLLLQNIQQLKIVKQERARINAQIGYLKTITKNYTDYRDIYFRIATLDYQLGNIEESKKYLRKALDADPNFKEGRVLGAQIGI